MKNAPRRSRQKAKPRSSYHLKGKTRQIYDSTPLHKGKVARSTNENGVRAGSAREGLPVNRSTSSTFYRRISHIGLNPAALAALYDKKDNQ